MRLWEYVLLVLAFCVAVVLVLLGRRRTALLMRLPPRLALAVAIALSYFPAVGCQAQGEAQPSAAAAQAGTPQAYAEVGAVWREMTAHSSGRVHDEAAFRALGERMLAALDTAGASHGLRVLLYERYDHIGHVTYLPISCYAMSPLGGARMESRTDIEKQLASLEALRAVGTVPAEALAKARSALAADLELRLRAEAVEAARGRGPQAQQALVEQYNAGRLEASDDATALAADCASLSLGEAITDDLSADGLRGYPNVAGHLVGVWQQMTAYASAGIPGSEAPQSLRQEMDAAYAAGEVPAAALGLLYARNRVLMAQLSGVPGAERRAPAPGEPPPWNAELEARIADLARAAVEGPVSLDQANHARDAIAAALQSGSPGGMPGMGGGGGMGGMPGTGGPGGTGGGMPGPGGQPGAIQGLDPMSVVQQAEYAVALTLAGR